jgi:hypothetical protein
MSYLKKFGLAIAAIVFMISISAISGNAQGYRNREWRNRDNNGQNQRWRRDGRNDRNEYRQQSRQRWRIYQQRNRYYRNDGYLGYWERRRLANRYYQYRRNVRRDRRNW